MHSWISLAPSRRRILAGAASLPRCLAASLAVAGLHIRAARAQAPARRGARVR